MIRLLARAMKNQKGVLSLFILGLVLILLTLPLALVSLDDAMTTIEDDITQHARGTYDILIRPEGARNQIEVEFGLVEENYLTTGNGGISIKSWKEIRDMDEVEIAAPVASLGYYTGESKSFSTWLPSQSTRAKINYYTSDGIHHYPIDDEEDSIGFLLEQEEVPMYHPPFDILSKGKAVFYTWYPPMFMLPNTYHLMVGVDPESEGELTGISFDAIHKPLSDLDKLNFQFAGDAEVINVMKLKDVRVPIEAELVWASLDIDKEQTASWKEEFGLQQDDTLMASSEEQFTDLFNRLLAYPSVDEKTYSINFKDAITPFDYRPFMVTENLDVAPYDGGVHGSTSSSSTKEFYFAEPVYYKIDQDGQISVEKINEPNGVPAYRNITEHGGRFSDQSGTDVSFVINPTGEYSIVEFQDSLSASPLGIYQLAPTLLKKTIEGDDVTEPIELLSTSYPGSFISTPAHGIISLEAAEVIKGEEPIDAIRVRVANIDTYTTEAEEQISALAERFLQMGYEVDIVAGASYQKLDVFIEGIGLVSQPWTTLGAAASIVSGWSGTSFLLSIIFALTSLVYVVNRLYFYWQEKVTEITLLIQLGWERKDIKQFYRRELMVIILFAWVLSSIGLFIFAAIMDNLAMIGLLQWHTLLSGIIVLSVLVTVEWKCDQLMMEPQKSKVDYTEIGNHSEDENTLTDIKPLKTSLFVKSRTVEKIYLSWRSIRYFISHIISTIIQIGLVAALSIFVYLSIYATVEQTSVTILGEYVNFRVGAIHIFMLMSAYTLAALTMAESLSSLFSSRKKEIETFISFGWQVQHILGHWLREISLWSACAVFLGHIIGVLLYTSFYPFSIHDLLMIGLSITGFFCFILLLSTVLLYQFLPRVRFQES